MSSHEQAKPILAGDDVRTPRTDTVRTEANETAQGVRIEAEGEHVLPLIVEEAHVSKREVVTGRLRVSTVTDVAEELVRQDLNGERVEVERVPVDQLIEPGAPAPQVRTEGNVTILPILEEVLVVEKRLRITEELRITHYATHEVAEVPVTVRKQRAVVERLTSEGETIAVKPKREP